MKNDSFLTDGPKEEVRQGEANRMTRRRFLKLGVSTLVGTGLACAGYGAFLEPRQLEITRTTLWQDRLPKAFDGMKIAHFSDLHLGFHTGAEDAKRITGIINAERPDLIAFTGDMVDGPAADMESAVEPLSALEAPLGAVSIVGNHDFDDVSRLISLQEKAGFTVLRNENIILSRKGHTIAVAGLDDWLLGMPDPDKALKGIPEHMYTVLLVHEPDYADIAVNYPFDLQLSGHSHGGQIRLPGIGEVITPPGSKTYIQGLYEVGRSGMPLYVNRGIGMTRLPFRFLCKPELSIITLKQRDYNGQRGNGS
ncbi:metallophosphoesterase [Paenibacillus sp. DMB20]|uniref:metallophosphoesterase n=1 Tax=Paenibacillus sp. DMB20 TaxID=1642570 RepID=UPI0006278E8F|nr:metallophosphoesterase [Paenibacillus sp. DMB20]KKO50945.1 phosphoesterase [Paenibacillus sp. DMB20]